MRTIAAKVRPTILKYLQLMRRQTFLDWDSADPVVEQTLRSHPLAAFQFFKKKRDETKSHRLQPI